ncbi:MAG: UbiA family prenyltransferase [Candidatus Micrarchaeales archaeon]|nr:UbiA family prenyltransferase [Candidatus Micrarchaeales archaeon]
MASLSAVLKLTRIEHSVMLAIAVVAAELISGVLPSPGIFVLALIPPIFVSMGAFAVNDYFDIKVDRFNKRYDRPLVSKKISKKGAMYVIISCFIIGILPSVFINAYAFIIVVAFAVLAILYSYKLKEVLLVGNLYIAFTMVIPFIYGNFIVADSFNTNIILISFVIFLSGLAREIHGMMRDYSGDTKGRHIKNVVYYLKLRNSGAVAAVLYFEAIAISIAMFFLYLPFQGNAVYLIPIVMVDIALAYVAVLGIYKGKNPKSAAYSIIRNASLGAMSVALLTYLAAALFYVAI